MRRVVVTGLGAVTPLGVGVRRTWTRLIDGACGIQSLQDLDPAYSSIPSQVAGLVPRGLKKDGGWTSSEWLNPGDERNMAQFTQYAVAATREAIEDAGLNDMTNEERENTGVCVGSGIGNFLDVYNTSVAFSQAGHKKVPPLFIPRLLINLAAGHIATTFSLHGPNLSPTTACTTGLHALTHSLHLLRQPNSPIHTLLAGASESCIHPLALSGFARARSLATSSNDAPHRASRPFDSDRDGFVIAEGAGILVLEELEHARARGAEIYAEVKGAGESADAGHMTAPRADGRYAALAMRRALVDTGGVRPRDVGYVNAHATSTVLGDRAENRAVRDVLLGGGGDTKDRASEINISSTKGALGHLLGAAGSVEAIFTVLALKRGILPPTLNLDAVGDRTDASAGDSTEQDEWSANYIPHTAQPHPSLSTALTNSFGFGGTNACVCFTRFDG